MAARYKRNLIPIGDKSVMVYASPRISAALHELTIDMTLYQGVRFAQVMEALYEQGKKDGARGAFEAIESKVKEAVRLIPHRNPGKPRKRKT
jgi:hypothetical protein